MKTQEIIDSVRDSSLWEVLTVRERLETLLYALKSIREEKDLMDEDELKDNSKK